MTFQRADAIAGILRDVIDCDPPWDGAGVILSSQYVEDWTGDDVKEYLDLYVGRRNRIVHGGDLRLEGTSATDITYRYVDQGIDIVKAVGNGTAASIDRRLRTASAVSP